MNLESKQNESYRFHCENKASIGEENYDNRDKEMEGHHVDDIGLVVIGRVQSVIVRPTGALHSLRHVPV